MVADYTDGGLKMLHIRAKFKSLKLAWVRRLCSENLHPWMIIPKKFIKIDETFFPNIKPIVNSRIPMFYRQMLNYWLETSQNPITVDSVLSQFVWNNIFININSNPIKKFMETKLFVKDLFYRGNLVPWAIFKQKYNIGNNIYYKWRQLISAIPSQWKNLIKNSENIPEPYFHLNYVSRIIPVESLSSKMIYGMLIHKIKEKSSSEITIQNKINDHNINWPYIYNFAWQTSIDSYSRTFQFKCLHNILFLNERLFKLKHSNTQLCSFCNLAPENMIHLFSECHITKELWRQIQTSLPEIQLADLTPGSAFFGLNPLDDLLANHIHLIFRIALYNSRKNKKCSILYIKRKIVATKKLELNMTFFNNEKKLKTLQKWNRVPDSLFA